MSDQAWNPKLYDSHHRYVSKLSSDLITFLDPKPGETILDLGCGTGILSEQISQLGSRVWGVDSSKEMILTAQTNFPPEQSTNLQFIHGTIGEITFDYPVDAIISNATLHWVLDPTRAIKNMFQLLRPGGRFIVEFGGKKNINLLLSSMDDLPDPPRNHFYFPSIAEYSSLLEAEGFEVHLCRWFRRPTQLSGGINGISNYVSMYFPWILQDLPGEAQEVLLNEIHENLKPKLWQGDHWIADYCRLQVIAIKT